MESVIYINRAFRPDREATISVRSRALNYGLGCFAGIRGYKTDDGQQVNVFRLDRHVRRLEHSARIIHLRLSGSQSEIAAVIVELIRRNEMRGDVYVRPIVFANSNELSPVLDPDTSETAIFCMPLGRYLSAGFVRGYAAIILFGAAPTIVGGPCVVAVPYRTALACHSRKRRLTDDE